MRVSGGRATRFRRTVVLGGVAPQTPQEEDPTTQPLNCPLNRGRPMVGTAGRLALPPQSARLAS